MQSVVEAVAAAKQLAKANRSVGRNASTFRLDDTNASRRGTEADGDEDTLAGNGTVIGEGSALGLHASGDGNLSSSGQRSDLMVEGPQAQTADASFRHMNGVAFSHEMVSVLFVYVENLDAVSTATSPTALVQALNELYVRFDAVTERLGVYKVMAIANMYLVVSGAPEPDPFHSIRVCDAADRFMQIARQASLSVGDQRVTVKIGINTGPVAAGVIGRRTFNYHIFGDTVNVASRMCSTARSMSIHMSAASAAEIGKTDPDGWGARLVDRGVTVVKGKGKMRTYDLRQHVHQVRRSLDSPAFSMSQRHRKRMSTFGQVVSFVKRVASILPGSSSLESMEENVDEASRGRRMATSSLEPGLAAHPMEQNFVLGASSGPVAPLMPMTSIQARSVRVIPSAAAPSEKPPALSLQATIPRRGSAPQAAPALSMVVTPPSGVGPQQMSPSSSTPLRHAPGSGLDSGVGLLSGAGSSGPSASSASNGISAARESNRSLSVQQTRRYAIPPPPTLRIRAREKNSDMQRIRAEKQHRILLTFERVNSKNEHVLELRYQAHRKRTDAPTVALMLRVLVAITIAVTLFSAVSQDLSAEGPFWLVLQSASALLALGAYAVHSSTAVVSQASSRSGTEARNSSQVVRRLRKGRKKRRGKRAVALRWRPDKTQAVGAMAVFACFVLLVLPTSHVGHLCRFTVLALFLLLSIFLELRAFLLTISSVAMAVVFFLISLSSLQHEPLVLAVQLATGLAAAAMVSVHQYAVETRVRRKFLVKKHAYDQASKCQRLLRNMLPSSAHVERLMRGDTIVETLSDVVLLYSDVVGFTTLSSKLTHTQLIHLLHDLYTAFDMHLDDYGLYKIETIGDAFIVIGGLDTSASLFVDEMDYAQMMGLHAAAPQQPDQGRGPGAHALTPTGSGAATPGTQSVSLAAPGFRAEFGQTLGFGLGMGGDKVQLIADGVESSASHSSSILDGGANSNKGLASRRESSRRTSRIARPALESFPSLGLLVVGAVGPESPDPSVSAGSGTPHGRDSDTSKGDSQRPSLQAAAAAAVSLAAAAVASTPLVEHDGEDDSVTQLTTISARPTPGVARLPDASIRGLGSPGMLGGSFRLGSIGKRKPASPALPQDSMPAGGELLPHIGAPRIAAPPADSAVRLAGQTLQISRPVPPRQHGAAMHHLMHQPSKGVRDEGQAAIRAVHADVNFGLDLGSGFGSSSSSSEDEERNAPGSRRNPKRASAPTPASKRRNQRGSANNPRRRRTDRASDPRRQQTTWSAIRALAGLPPGDASVVPLSPPGQDDVAAALERISRRTVTADSKQPGWQGRRGPRHAQSFTETPEASEANTMGPKSSMTDLSAGEYDPTFSQHDGAVEDSKATEDSTINSGRAEENYTAAMCELALDMLDEVFELKAQYGLPEFAMRIGIHAGGVVGGVIGTHRPRYFVWGPDTVIANAMESACPVGQVMLSAAAQKRVAGISTIELDNPGRVNVQGIEVSTVLLRGVGDRDVPQIGTTVTLDEFGMPVLHLPEPKSKSAKRRAPPDAASRAVGSPARSGAQGRVVSSPGSRASAKPDPPRRRPRAPLKSDSAPISAMRAAIMALQDAGDSSTHDELRRASSNAITATKHATEAEPTMETRGSGQAPTSEQGPSHSPMLPPGAVPDEAGAAATAGTGAGSDGEGSPFSRQDGFDDSMGLASPQHRNRLSRTRDAVQPKYGRLSTVQSLGSSLSQQTEANTSHE
jgi:class 3 adenylate cyclase